MFNMIVFSATTDQTNFDMINRFTMGSVDNKKKKSLLNAILFSNSLKNGTDDYMYSHHYTQLIFLKSPGDKELWLMSQKQLRHQCTDDVQTAEACGNHSANENLDEMIADKSLFVCQDYRNSHIAVSY